MARKTYTIELDDSNPQDCKLIDLIKLYKWLRKNEHDIYAVLTSRKKQIGLLHTERESDE